jgi:soluble lytic murein transglycosylase-like protein
MMTSLVWVALITLLVATPFLLQHLAGPDSEETSAAVKTERSAPPDLARLRAPYTAALEAIARGDQTTARRLLESIDFGDRAIEEYRLYHLATALQLERETDAARVTLAKLWRRNPQLVYREDVGFSLGALYADLGKWSEAGEIYGSLTAISQQPAVKAASREQYIRAKFYANDPAGVVLAARNIIVENPKTAQTGDAIRVFRALAAIPETRALPLSLAERVHRGEHLLRDGDPRSALAELNDLASEPLPQSYANRVRLARAQSLARVGRVADAEALLSPLFPGDYRTAIPALELSARNNRTLSASINPVEYRTVKERKRVGTRRVKRKGKTVRIPTYRTTSRSVKVINREKEAKKESYRRLYVERLRDLLQLPIPDEVRKQTLTTLIALAEEKNQEAYLRQLIPQLVKLDHLIDTGLQRFWDKGWAAYKRGDLATARANFDFIQSTYGNPNTQRQSKYWFARTIEKQGEKGRAKKIYTELANAPYEDIYARYAQKRAGIEPAKTRRRNPLRAGGDDWAQIAEKSMPKELRLAYELNALGAVRDARGEIQKNANAANRKFADAILADLHYADGSLDLGNRYVRRAWPQLATVEQDSVPAHFIKLYYPVKYEAKIRAEAAKRGLDPYLVMGLIRQESAFNPNARSVVGASGLMQIMPATGRELGQKLLPVFSDKRLTDPEVNITLGTYYLKQLINLLNGEVELAVAGYNGGPYRIKRWREANRRQPLDEFLEGIPLSETRNYVKRVTLLHASYARFLEPEK